MRTKTFEGETNNLPKEGEVFQMVGDALVQPADCRIFTSTLVLEIMPDKHLPKSRCEFKTKNSTYALQWVEGRRNKDEQWTEYDSPSMPCGPHGDEEEVDTSNAGQGSLG